MKKAIFVLCLIFGVIFILTVIGIMIAAAFDETGEYGLVLVFIFCFVAICFVKLNEWHEKLVEKEKK